MFDYRWRVNGETLLSLVVEPGADFTWSMHLLQGVLVRLALDPVRYPWYWLAAQTLILLGAAALLTSTGFRPNEAWAARRSCPMREHMPRAVLAAAVLSAACSRPRRPRTRQLRRSH